MQPDSSYREELLRVQQIANPDIKSRVMSTLAGTSDLGLPGKAGSEYKPQTVYELMNKYSPPALIAKGIGKAYEASPDAVKKNVGEFAEDISKAYQTARNMSPVIRGAEAVLTAAPKMPEGYIGGSPMDNPMANMETGPGMLDAFTAFHGSPHRFKMFDAAHIGSGEGNQAFGHGIYFAEKPSVAKTYAANTPIKISDAAAKAEWQRFKENHRDIADDFAGFIGDVAPFRLSDTDIANEFQNVFYRQNHNMEQLVNEDIVQYILEKGNDVNMAAGHLYKVDIPDEWIPKMLDWDAPLSEQSDEVKKALEGIFPSYEDAQKIIAENERLANVALESQKTSNSFTPEMQAWNDHYSSLPYRLSTLRSKGDEVTGGYVLEALEQALKSRPAAAEFLNSLGIPGHKYLDSGSRAAGGTRNFVIYPGMEEQVKILERNNIPFDSPDFRRGGHVSLDDLHAKYAEGGRVMADELARVQSIINAVP